MGRIFFSDENCFSLWGNTQERAKIMDQLTPSDLHYVRAVLEEPLAINFRRDLNSVHNMTMGRFKGLISQTLSEFYDVRPQNYSWSDSQIKLMNHYEHLMNSIKLDINNTQMMATKIMKDPLRDLIALKNHSPNVPKYRMYNSHGTSVVHILKFLFGLG